VAGPISHTWRLWNPYAELDPRPSRDKVRAHRERLRPQSLRPTQFRVPGVRAPTIKAEAHRQSLAVAQSERGSENQGFIDAISDREGG
jgi:hypothetical protein